MSLFKKKEKQPCWFILSGKGGKNTELTYALFGKERCPFLSWDANWVNNFNPVAIFWIKEKKK